MECICANNFPFGNITTHECLKQDGILFQTFRAVTTAFNLETLSTVN